MEDPYKTPEARLADQAEPQRSSMSATLVVLSAALGISIGVFRQSMDLRGISLESLDSIAPVTVLLLGAWLVGTNLWARSLLKTFLERHPEIGSAHDLEVYKELVRPQMYLALLNIVLILLYVLACCTMAASNGTLGLTTVLSLSAVFFFVGRHTKRFEERARFLPCATPELQRAHADISDCWTKKALPNF